MTSCSIIVTPDGSLRAGIRYTKHMRSLFSISAALLLAAAVTTAQAATGLSPERGGLGLKEPAAPPDLAAARILRGEYSRVGIATADEPATTTAYRGLRERTRLGLSALEAYGGLTRAFSDRIAGSLEFAPIESTALSPRRYSLAGQLQTVFDATSGLSIGLTYRVYEPDSETRFPGASDIMPANGYSLVPVRTPGTGLGPSYQLQLHYQYNLTTTFGLVLGRELETFTSGFDAVATGSRQFSFTGQHWLTPSWALSYDVLSNDPSSLRLQGLRLGVRYRF